MIDVKDLADKLEAIEADPTYWWKLVSGRNGSGWSASLMKGQSCVAAGDAATLLGAVSLASARAASEMGNLPAGDVKG